MPSPDATQRDSLLPLPSGEGRGEGNQAAQILEHPRTEALNEIGAGAWSLPHPGPLPEGEGEEALRPKLALAVDIGGTFTDVTLQDPATGQAWRAKVPSVPADPSRAFIAGMEAALALAGAPPSAIARVLHGTTVATNLILEGKGAKAALVTTAGFRHVLDIGRQDIPRSANLYAWRKPRRPVPASRVFEVAERVGPGGDVLLPLDEASVAVAAEACRRHGVQAVAVCLLHGFANPVHERRVVELLQR